MEILSKSEAQTKKVARLLAEEILRSKNRLRPELVEGAVVIGLEGELGSGKTRFVQGFAKGLGIKQRLTSPTFVLMKKYRIFKRKIFNFQFSIFNFYHIDCYRLNKPKDILDLDFKEIISNPENIVLIEWAEKIKKILPKNTIWIEFEVISENKRKIKI